MPKLSNVKRAAALFALYSAAMGASIWLAYQLRFDFNVEADLRGTFVEIILAVVAIKLLSLLIFRQFDTLLSYFGLADAQRMLLAMGAADLLLLVIRLAKGVTIGPPRSVILTDFFLSFFGLCVVRVGLRLFRERFGPAAARHVKDIETRRRLGVYGAGDSGAALIRELSTRRGFGIRVVGVFDDDGGDS